ncbi:MAG: cell division protein ZapD [Gammaproteobacteria bacterium]
MKYRNRIIYEQPLNEHCRVCLRLEELLNQASALSDQTDIYSSKALIITLVDLLNILDRPDLRNRLSKELSRYLSNLQGLQQTPGVDLNQLNNVILDIETILSRLKKQNGKFASELREIEIINQVRHHLHTPGGTPLFDMPHYYYWLNQPDTTRHRDLQRWLTWLDDIKLVIDTYLRLTRDSALPRIKTANQGFFQTGLDSQSPGQLIRIGLPSDSAYFPQCSVGRHGLSVRFLQLDNELGRTKQTDASVEFELTYCVF